MNEWKPEAADLPQGRGRRLCIGEDGAQLAFADVIRLLTASAGFRSFFNDLLAEVPFAAFRWETPPVCRNNRDRPFECVVLESRELLSPPEPGAFAAQFGGRRMPEVVGFRNLGNDAFMVVPCPGRPSSAYSHLAAFVRDAPEVQRDRLWLRVGEAMDARLGLAPIWLNTAGAGVAWLHLRLDSRPKYYGYAPYRDERP